MKTRHIFKDIPPLSTFIGLAYWTIFLLLVVISSLIFYFINDIQTDISDHVQVISERMFYDQILYFFYYMTIQLMSGFSDDPEKIRISILTMLSFWVGLKMALSFYYSGFKLKDNFLESIGILLLITSVVILTPLPVLLPGWYLGKIFPNVWHNPSINFTIPFCIIAFFSAIKYLRSYNLSYILSYTISCIIIIMSKPSFFFCLAPVFPCFCLQKYHFSRPFWIALFATALCAVPLFLEIFSMYILPAHKTISTTIQPTTTEPTRIAFGFFEVALRWTGSYKNVALNLLVSSVMPATYIVLYFRAVSKNIQLLFAISLMTVGVLISSFLHHTGLSLSHGNFYWQNVPAAYLLYLSLLIDFIVRWQHKLYRVSWREVVFFLMYGLHVASGIFYIYRIVFMGYYT